MGIGRALGFEDGWVAGAIISGAYFGDKISLMSDTTVLASSTAEVPLFTHIKYMLITTTPSLIIAIIVFTIVGLNGTTASAADTLTIESSLNEAFNLSPWLLIVPIITGLLIAKKLPAIVTLFASVVMAAIAMVIFQPEIVSQIAQSDIASALNSFEAVVIAATTSTSIETNNELLNNLVATRGMGGMMDTVWLIICAMCFGGVMYGSGMLSALSQIFLRVARRTVSVVAPPIIRLLA